MLSTGTTSVMCVCELITTTRTLITPVWCDFNIDNDMYMCMSTQTLALLHSHIRINLCVRVHNVSTYWFVCNIDFVQNIIKQGKFLSRCTVSFMLVVRTVGEVETGVQGVIFARKGVICIIHCTIPHTMFSEL